MIKKYIKKEKVYPNREAKRGIVLLFTVMLSSIILAIALGVSNIAFKEARFSTSAKDTNESFFAADIGAECALYNDKVSINKFPLIGTATTLSCGGSNSSVSYSYDGVATAVYSFVINGLGSLGQGCAVVTVKKDNSLLPLETTITSKGYNIGTNSCGSNNPNRLEREIKVTY